MNKTVAIILLLAVLILLAVGFNFYSSKYIQPTNNTSTVVAPNNDSQAAIDSELDIIDPNVQLNADFQPADKDIQSL